MWDSKTVVGCCKLVCVLLYSTSTCYEEGLVNFLVDPIVHVTLYMYENLNQAEFEYYEYHVYCVF